MDNKFYFGFNTAEERKKRRKAELYSMSEQVSTFFWDEAPQHGLEMREGQQDMSFEIVDALINDQHFAIEAGVGIGKSFGYLVPVLLYSKRMNKPVIIATSTIALQEQLWRDVHAVMPLLGLNRDVILAKGQTHYLCNKRADAYMCDPKADPPDALKEGIQQGYEERKDFPEVLPQGVWDNVNVQRFSMKNCGSCEKKCKYYKVRATLKFTDGVVLCNQDFLTQHLMKLRRGQEGLINAAADLLVVDEAHNLDDKVRSATTERFGQSMLFGMIKSAFYELRSSDQSSVSREKREAESAIIAFYNCLKAQIQKQINEADQDMRYADRFFFDQNGSAVELLTEMNAAIHNLSSSIQIYSSMDFRNNRSFAASDDLDAVSDSLSELLDRIDDMLIWIEQRGSNTELVYCPKNTKEIVSRLYFNGDERTILTSATLTNSTTGTLEEQYSYFISNTGFPIGERGCLTHGVRGKRGIVLADRRDFAVPIDRAHSSPRKTANLALMRSAGDDMMEHVIVGLVCMENGELDAQLFFAEGLEPVINEVPVFRDFAACVLIKHDLAENRLVQRLVVLCSQQERRYAVFASAARGNILRAAHRSNSILKLTYLPPLSSRRITAS